MKIDIWMNDKEAYNSNKYSEALSRLVDIMKEPMVIQ